MNDRVIKNPNFNNNGEFHASLKARGKGAKDFPNSHTEVKYLGNGKFGASIAVGHRVFFDKADDNKPKKHKLTDERPSKDYVLIQGARCCVEVHPYYAKYFDVQHEEIRLYEERWVVQRLFKEPDEWRDVDAYSPQMTVEEYPEPAGGVVKVIVTYDTDYGVLTVEYFQRDGNALKHNVTFKNTSSLTETFRVLQRWAGIIADKVDGKAITAPTERFQYGFRFEKEGKVCIHENLSSFMPLQVWQDECEAAKRMWVRHGECNRCGKCCLNCSNYSDESPHCKIYEVRSDFCKEFPWSPEQIKDIPECSYSFEATGVVVSLTKLQPAILDVHPQGMKADFIYGNWLLTQGEVLEIDPDTVTLDNPTLDGEINHDEYGGSPPYAYSLTGTSIAFGRNSDDHGELDWKRGFAEWYIMSLIRATITKVEFRYNGEANVADNAYIKAMSIQVSLYPQFPSDPQLAALWSDIGAGAAYLSNNSTFPEVGTGKDVGGASGPAWSTDPKTDLQTAASAEQSWFALGFMTTEVTEATWDKFYSQDKTDAADPKPTLYVEYTPGTGVFRQVGASSDDCYRRLSPSSWELAGSSQQAGTGVAGATQRGGGMRFTNITIPQGATIDEAYLILRCNYVEDDAESPPHTRISAEDIDDAATFADDSAAFDTRWAARTTARVDWDDIPAWVVDSDYNSPEIKTVIQEIVNREGWASGQDIVIFWEDFENRTPAQYRSYRSAYSYDGSVEFAPQLVITFTPPVEGGLENKSANMGAKMIEAGVL